MSQNLSTLPRSSSSCGRSPPASAPERARSDRRQALSVCGCTMCGSGRTFPISISFGRGMFRERRACSCPSNTSAARVAAVARSFSMINFPFQRGSDVMRRLASAPLGLQSVVSFRGHAFLTTHCVRVAEWILPVAGSFHVWSGPMERVGLSCHSGWKPKSAQNFRKSAMRGYQLCVHERGV